MAITSSFTNQVFNDSGRQIGQTTEEGEGLIATTASQMQQRFLRLKRGKTTGSGNLANPRTKSLQTITKIESQMITVIAFFTDP